MKRFILQIFIGLLLTVSISAQVEENHPKLLNEFGRANSEMLEVYLTEMAVAEKMRKNAIEILTRHGVEASRLIVKHGGFRDSTRNLELWFVPEGGAIPKAKPDYVPRKKRNS